jgi:Leucine-rich repeat (LRR) protein
VKSASLFVLVRLRKLQDFNKHKQKFPFLFFVGCFLQLSIRINNIELHIFKNTFQISNVLILTYIVLATVIQKRDACTLPPAMQGKCHCQHSTIKCLDLSTIVPQSTQSTYYRLEVKDSGLVLNANSFNNWILTEVVLDNCNLTDSSFSNDTFNGLESDLRTVSLANNNITRLPNALSKFTKLEHLDVSGNPINEHNFDENILREIGDHLLTFSFGTAIGGKELTKWPTTLKHLQRLQELTLTAGNINVMSSRAFHGYEGTLLRLTIAHTNLRSMPLAISRLRYLQELHFDHNTNVGDYGVRVPLLRGFLLYLNQLSLKDDNITTFPEVLKSFDRLEIVNMDENNMKFVSDKSAMAVTQISSLSLQNSGITRVPGAIQDITLLNVLDLSNNSIHAIETHDFRESSQLLTMKLDNNPILYISDQALSGLINLRKLEMRNVLLKRVPCAIEAMIRNHHPGFILINLSENKLECNCGLKWLYDLKNDIKTQSKSFKLIGNCDTINSSIDDYIDKQLHVCPPGVACSD